MPLQIGSCYEESFALRRVSEFLQIPRQDKQFRLTAKSAAGFHNNERKVQCYNHCSLLCIRRLMPDDIS